MDRIDRKLFVQTPCQVHDGLTAPVGNVTLRLPAMDGLDWIAGLAGYGGSLSQCVENTVYDVHIRTYPINGYQMQALNPIISSASIVPSWQSAIMDESDFNLDAMRAAMKDRGVTQSELAKVLNLNQSAVSNILNGSRRVKVEEASTIKAYLGLREAPTVQMVPIIGLTSAGNWREAILSPGGVMPVPINVAGTKAFAVEVKGDSMDRIVPEGGYVVVDPDQTQLYNDRVYLICNDDHETQVKLYRSNPARFEPASNNEMHQTLYVGEHQIKVIGRVVWQGAPV